MIEKALSQVYMKFKLHYYREFFKKIASREASLTTTEAYCVEIIHALDGPTINEFAEFISVSSPNAAYKVNSLVKKGYITREQCPDDKREYRLYVTDRYFSYYNLSEEYVKTVSKRIEKAFPKEDLDTFYRILSYISDRLMPESLGTNLPETAEAES